MTYTEARLQSDIRMISAVPFIPALLNLVCAATGMGFAAVARVTEERWIAGSVRDQIRFGLAAGGELPVASTICHEIRQQEREVVIDSVSEDAVFCSHHTPATYGFESYISFPIVCRERGFFGTLCAIDPKAAQLNNPEITGLFRVLAELLAVYLDEADDIHESVNQSLPDIEARLSQALAAVTADRADRGAALRAQTHELLKLTAGIAPGRAMSNAD